MESTPANKKRFLEFISLSLLMGLAAAVVTLVFFGWLTDEVLEGDSQQFDEATRAAVHQFATPTLTTIMRGISFLGSTRFLTIASGIVILIFAVRKWGREAQLFLLTMLGAALLNTTLTLAFRRAHPEPFFDLLPPPTYSFPSGHTLEGGCFFGALAAIAGARIRKQRLRAIVWTIATVMLLSIGLSRIY